MQNLKSWDINDIWVCLIMCKKNKTVLAIMLSVFLDLFFCPLFFQFPAFWNLKRPLQLNCSILRFNLIFLATKTACFVYVPPSFQAITPVTGCYEHWVALTIFQKNIAGAHDSPPDSDIYGRLVAKTTKRRVNKRQFLMFGSLKVGTY